MADPRRKRMRDAERAALRHAAQAYRFAIASQVAGAFAGNHWQEFASALAVLLAAAWARGAARVLEVRGVPKPGEPAAPPVHENIRAIADWVRSWEPTPVGAERAPVPEAAAPFAADAEAVATHESEVALPEMMKRSPDMAAAVQGMPVQPPKSMDIAGLDAVQRGRMRDMIADFIAEKPSIRQANGRIRAANLGEAITAAQAQVAPDLTDARLETVFRTVEATAQTQGQRQTLRDPIVRNFVPLLRWSAVRDARTRPTHAAMQGYIGTVDDYDAQHLGPPAGFNCFAPWQQVSGLFAFATRFHYSGPMVHIAVRSRASVAVTANHPVLTERGWVPAGKVKVGDKVIRCKSNAEILHKGLAENQRDHDPTIARDVFDALSVQGVTKSEHASQSDLDFHGDAKFRKGEVDVVWSERALLVNGDSTCLKNFSNRGFIHADAAAARSGIEGLGAHGARASSNGLPSAGALPLYPTGLLLNALPFHQFGLAPTTRDDAAIFEQSDDDRARNRKKFRDLQNAFTGLVESDDVVGVNVSHYDGPVYDFESDSGIVIAGGIMVSNCRCAATGVPISIAIEAGWCNPDGTINREAITAHNGARQALIDSGAFPDPGFVG